MRGMGGTCMSKDILSLTATGVGIFDVLLYHGLPAASFLLLLLLLLLLCFLRAAGSFNGFGVIGGNTRDARWHFPSCTSGLEWWVHIPGFLLRWLSTPWVFCA
jgi:hypothetical protein